MEVINILAPLNINFQYPFFKHSKHDQDIKSNV